jgi:hypothetical protein
MGTMVFMVITLILVNLVIMLILVSIIKNNKFLKVEVRGAKN